MGRQQAKKKRRRPKPPPDRTQFEDGDSELSLFVDDAPKTPRKKRTTKKKRSGQSGKKKKARAPAEHDEKTAVPGKRKSKSKKRPRAKTGNTVASGPHAKNQRPVEEKKKPREPRTQAAEGLAYAAGVLECTKGPEEGLSLSLIEGEYTIGRAKENSFILKDIAASRRHVKIEVRENRVFAKDMGSGNGTRVNGDRITEHELKNGDKLEIGNSVLSFRYVGKDQSQIEESASVPVPPASRSSDQERIVLAAERLAAELSERFRDEEESVPTASVPSHGKHNAAVPPIPGDGLSGEGLGIDVERAPDLIPPIAPPAAVNPPATPRSANDIRGGIPSAMWADNETRTRLPGNDELPSAPASSMPSMSAPSMSSYSPPPSRPTPPSAYVPQVQGVTAEPAQKSGGGRGIGLLLLLFVGFTLLGGAATAAYLWREDLGLSQIVADLTGTSPEAPEDESSYEELMQKAGAFAEAGDHESTLAWAEQALAKKPGDKQAQGVIAAARAALGVPQGKAAPSAEDSEAATPPPAETKVASAQKAAPPEEKAPAAPAAEKPAAETAPPPVEKAKPADPPPPQAKTKPQPKPKPKPKAKAKPKPKPKPKAKPKRAKAKAKPKPKPKPKPKRAAMTDADAKALFKKANKLFRSGDYDAACPLVKKVKAKAPGSSPWKAKAANVFKKRCE